MAMAAVRQVGENFGRILANRAGLFSRTKVTTSISPPEQLGWEDFESKAGGPGLLVVFNLGEGQVFFHVPSDLALTLIDLHLAGPGTKLPASRQLSETERQLISPLLSAVANSLGDAASSVFGETTAGPVSQVGGVSGLFLSNRRMPCTYFQADITVPSSQTPIGSIGVCTPVASLRPLLARLNETDRPKGHYAAAERAALKVPVTLTFRFPPVQVPFELARDLAPGQVLSIGHLLGQPLLLHVGGKALFKAVLVEHSRRSACEVIDVIDTSKGEMV